MPEHQQELVELVGFSSHLNVVHLAEPGTAPEHQQELVELVGFSSSLNVVHLAEPGTTPEHQQKLVELVGCSAIPCRRLLFVRIVGL